MKIRILVDSARTSPKPGEINMVVTEATKNKLGQLEVHFVKAILQTDHGHGWEEVPMEFISHKIGLNVPEAKS